MIKINEPQLPWLRTAIYHTGLDVKIEVTQCAGCVSANTRNHSYVGVTRLHKHAQHIPPHLMLSAVSATLSISVVVYEALVYSD